MVGQTQTPGKTELRPEKKVNLGNRKNEDEALPPGRDHSASASQRLFDGWTQGTRLASSSPMILSLIS